MAKDIPVAIVGLSNVSVQDNDKHIEIDEAHEGFETVVIFSSSTRDIKIVRSKGNVVAEFREDTISDLYKLYAPYTPVDEISYIDDDGELKVGTPIFDIAIERLVVRPKV